MAGDPEFSGFQFSPALEDVPALDTPFAGSGAYGNGLVPPQYQPQDFGLNHENLFEGPPWNTDQIDELIRNMQTESSLLQFP